MRHRHVNLGLKLVLLARVREVDVPGEIERAALRAPPG